MNFMSKSQSVSVQNHEAEINTLTENPNGITCQEQKKKPFGKILTLLIIFAILFTGAVNVYAFRYKIINTYAQITQTPAEYYRFVEQNNVNGLLTRIKPFLKANTDGTSTNTKVDVSLDRDTINSYLKDNMDTSLEDIESQIGLPLKSFGFNLFTGRNKDVMNESIGFRLNQQDIITGELYMNNTSKDYFIRLPELSDAYLDLSEEYKKQAANYCITAIPSVDYTIDTIKSYSNLFINHMTDVTLDQSILSSKNIKENCTKLSVKINNETLYKLLKDTLTEARGDNYIMNLLYVYNIPEKDYQEGIDSALESLEKSSNELLTDDITMAVYVDDNGMIIGREFSSKKTGTVFSYSLLTDGNYREFSACMNDGKGNTLLNITGNNTKNSNTNNGTATLKLIDPSIETDNVLSITCDYKDLRTEFKNNRFYHYGSFTIYSADMQRLKLTSVSSVNNDIQGNTTTFELDGKKLATIDSTTEYQDAFTAKMPSKEAKVYKLSEADSYLSSMDLEEYMKKLSDKLGVDMQNVLNNIGNLFGDLTGTSGITDNSISDDTGFDDEFLGDYEY